MSKVRRSAGSRLVTGGLTMTLDSYGPVHPDGTPVNPSSYDYRRAAWDAIAFPRLLDRFWQNLRRCVGWNVQYAGCVEPQRRLAPHAHFAIRGTIPRTVLREVAAATYHQVWWPTVGEPSDQAPVWNESAGSWIDMGTMHHCPPGMRRWTPSTKTPTRNPRTSCDSAPTSTPRASPPATGTSTGRSATSRSTSPNPRPTATP
jgi:hypothetical protein